MKRVIFLAFTLLVFFAACEEEDLVKNNPAPTQNNVDVSFVPYYGDSTIRTDSLYTNNFGNQFVIDSVRMLITDVMFIEIKGDTIEKESNYHVFSTVKPENAQIARLPGGGYNGRFVFINGIDTAAYYEAFTDPLIRETIAPFKRVADTAYNQFEIYGRLIKPNSDDSIPKIPLSYQIGTTVLVDTISTGTMAFSVDDTKDIRLVLLCDIKPALNSVDLFLNQTIFTDPSDFQDFQTAKSLRDSLKFGIF